MSIWVYLGCSAEERRSRQEIRFNIDIRFTSPPQGVESDQLDHTICYGKISERLSEKFSQGEYHLIEKIAGEAYLILKEICGEGELAVEVEKVKPPIDNLVGGAFFRYADFNP